jgi:signal transduction histidine kinase
VSWQIEQFLQTGAASILDALGDAISIQDTNLKVIYQNPEHIRLMGDHSGKQCYEAYQHRDAACPGCHLLTALREKRTNRYIGSTQHSRRGLIHVEIISSPLMDADGNVVAGIEAVRDITEQKMFDEKLKAITCDLEQKSWKLMSANKELESFSYTLSHDIKNYLARIEIAADVLKNITADTLTDSGRFLLGSISDSCSDIEETIESILRLSSTGKSGINPDKVDLGALAREIAEELTIQYPGHSVDFAVGVDLVAFGDKQLLKVMLRNLLGNAWKYTQGVSDPRVSFTAEKHGEEKNFAVRDNGIGFDMKESGRLFKAFSRLSSSEGKEGSGIGLATVRRVILCHNGDIWAEGTPGKGATFYFTLPVIPAE